MERFRRFAALPWGAGELIRLEHGALALVDGRFVLVFEDCACPIVGGGRAERQGAQISFVADRWMTVHEWQGAVGGCVSQDLKGKVPLVTGAARGLGLLVCRDLAHERMRIAGIDMRGELLAEEMAKLEREASAEVGRNRVCRVGCEGSEKDAHPGDSPCDRHDNRRPKQEIV